MGTGLEEGSVGAGVVVLGADWWESPVNAGAVASMVADVAGL